MDKEGLLQGKLALVTGAGQGNGRALALDVTDAEACAAAAADVQRHAGPIDVLVNNAGILIREGLTARARPRTGAACWT